jgi:thioredoxin-dependent peroxiredoxin
VQVYGLSPDDLASHEAFAAKHELNFPLLADVDSKWLESVGLWKEREWDGKKFMGALRTTMLVGPDGTIERLWENVQFKGHAEAVLAAIRGE